MTHLLQTIPIRQPWTRFPRIVWWIRCVEMTCQSITFTSTNPIFRWHLIDITSKLMIYFKLYVYHRNRSIKRFKMTLDWQWLHQMIKRSNTSRKRSRKQNEEIMPNSNRCQMNCVNADTLKRRRHVTCFTVIAHDFNVVSKSDCTLCRFGNLVLALLQ